MKLECAELDPSGKTAGADFVSGSKPDDSAGATAARPPQHLPDTIDEGKIETKFDKGVLMVTAAKKA